MPRARSRLSMQCSNCGRNRWNPAFHRARHSIITDLALMLNEAELQIVLCLCGESRKTGAMGFRDVI